ncbi:MAG: alpha/beta hydrolase [Planctomycetota bacterium]
MYRLILFSALTAAAIMIAPASEAARSQRVVFESHGDRLVGDLYLPDDYEAGDRLPAVVVTGSWTSVKEQMPARYASELADRGFAALAFDFRNWGQSEGDRRQYENPTLKTQDIVAAAVFLAERPEVDPQHIAGLGICASAGYMAGAVADSEHLGALVLVAPWLHDAEIVDAVYGGPGGVAGLIATSRAADQRFAETGESTMLPAASTTDESAVMFNAPYYTEEDRGLIPEYVNQFNVASWEPWLTFDGVAIADRLGGVPVQVVHSDAAAVPQGTREFYDRLTGPKAALWLEDVGQLDFYDRPGPVSRASDAVAAYLNDAFDK